MGKSGRHKTENTFRFQTFSERIKNINIDVIHQIRHHDDTPEETETYFGLALQKQSELNCTEYFVNFQREISQQVKTFNQLVHHEEELVSALKKHLLVPNSMAIPALLHLLVQLARDLQSDFYRHFHELFEILVQVLGSYSRDVEVLEATFSCLSYLFNYFSSLLSQQYKEYVRNFAAESFAFLMRKSKQPSELFDFMFKSLEKEPDTCEGVGRLMFEMMKGVKEQFHSSTTKAEIASVETHWQSMKKGNKTMVSETLERLLRLLNTLIKFRAGKLLSKPNNIAKNGFPVSTGQVILTLISDLLTTVHSRLHLEVTAKLMPAVFKTGYPAEVIYTFTRTLFNLPLFERDVLPNLLKYTKANMDSPTPQMEESTLTFITDLLIWKCPLLKHGGDLLSLDTYMLDFTSSPADSGVPAYISSILQHASDWESIPSCKLEQSKLWAALICLPHVRPIDKDQAVLHVSTLLKTLMDFMSSETGPSPEESWPLIGCQALVSMVMLLGNSKVRHLSLRILASFNLQLPPSEVESTVGVFEICLSAETTPLSVQEYREKQRHLQRLEFSIVQNSIPAGPFAQVPLRYLLGNLFVNFKLLWEPIRLLISSHAQNMEREAFWEVVGSHLEMAAEKCEHQLSDRDSPRATNDSDTENPSPTEGITALMSQSLASLSLEESAPPNYTNFRDQLWQTLNMFSEKCAAKTRLLTPLLFRFLNSAPSQNVLRKDKHTAKHNLSDRELDSEERMDVQEGKSRKRTRTAKNGNEGNKKPRTQKVSENVDTNLDVEKVIHTRIRTRSQCDSSTDINNELVNITNEDNESESARTNASDSPEKQSVVTHRVRTRSMTSVDGNSEMEDYSTPRKSSNRSRTRGDTSNNEKDTPTEGSTSKRVHRVGNRHMTSQSESEMETDSSPSMRNLRSKRMTTKSSNATDPEGDTSDSGLDEDTDMSDAEVTTEENVKNPKSKRLSAIKEYEDVNDSVSSNSVEGVTDEKNNKLETVKTNTESPKKSGVTQGLGKNAREGEGKGEVTESKKRGKAATSSLVVQLQLFSKFKDPHSVYREPELRKLYFDLLIHKNADVQKTAFKENFERLLDDKTFKNEIVLFSISQENSVVSPEHRPDLLPVLMRILYGKMHVKTGKGTSGKQHSHVRQSIILGFLNGCQHEELEVFIDLMVRHIQANTDLTSVLPVKKMQGALGSIEMIFKKLGHLMDVFLPSVIQMIVGMATMCGVLLGNRDNIVPHVINPLKSIRQNALYRLMQLFKNYDKYPWRPVEVDAVFESAVWPQLANLSFEGVYHPTPLLKLLHCWTNNPRYFPLLAKHHKDNPELSPLPHVIKLLLNPDCGVPVCIKIMEMVDNLLREYDPEQEIRFIETTDITQLPSIEGPDASLGVSLLQPHVSNILVYIQRYVTEFFATLSQYVENETQSVTLVGLLLPFLNPSLSRNEVVCRGDEELERLAAIVEQLNSWDETRTEEPDYTRRLEGYRAAMGIVKAMMTMEIRVCLTLLTNCCYFISTVDDMSLRDSSTLCVVTIISQFTQTGVDEKAYNTIIMTGLMPEMRGGLRHKSQVYKRSRALRRLIKYVDTNTVKNETINNIFLPLVSSFLTDDLYKKHTTVQDAAVDAIGVICRVLPWKLYATQLKFYLKLLPKCFSRQKLLVRVIVSIMDNFHFDLSQSTLDVKNTPVPKVERPPPEEKKNTTVAATGEEKDPNNLDSDEDDVEVAPEINEAVEEEVAGKSIQGKLLCTPKLATTIHEVILKQVVAQLHKILIQKNKNDEEHKVNKTKVPEDEEILRVPIALAMVKLLQNLPKGAVERYLPGILLKVCNFLKSRSPDVRNSARETLVKIQSTLGPRFFPFILSELRSSLRRGYQRHVLCYTVFMLLKHMEESVRPGDIDVCLNSLQQVSNEEIFGEVSDEKDIDGIKSKILETSYSHRSARKVGEVLRKVTIGLLDNKNITTETLLVFIHGLTSDTLPQLNEKKKATVKKEEKPGQRPPSCLLLQSAAPRGGAKPRTNKKTNKHVLVEFGLHLLGQLLRKQRVVAMETSHLQMLDPLVPMMADCLHSKYIMVKDVAGGMFVLLRNYATAGAAKGDNKELITMLFKAVTVLVREVKTYTLETGQLQVLLTFCDEDIHDHTRQSTAFSLLKAILSRKLDVPELHELIKKVREMSISAESPHVQRECRQAVLQYMLDYPLGKQLDHHLQFYVAQLSYEVETGRESTLEMLAAFFSAFPQKLLSDYSGLFFLPLAASLVNDESAKCRRLIALAIKSLLGKLDHNARSNLFSHALKWFMDSKLKLRILAAQLCGLFVEVEGGQFESRLTTLLPMLDQHLEPGKYTQHESAATEHDQDLMIYQVLNTLLKTLRECGQVLNMHKHMDSLNNIWACQLYGILFAAWQPEQLVAMEIQEPKHYLARGTKKKLKSLAIDFVTQLQSEYLTEELASQIIKNLVFIARCANLFDLQPVTTVTSEGQSAIPSEEGAVAGGDRAGVNSGRDFSVLWLRTHVFKWLAAVSMELGSAMDVAVLRTMIPPLQREINDTSNIQDAALKSLANEVVELLKKTVGVETFTEVYANTQRVRAGRRDQRKSNKAIQAVANPEIAAKRKLKKNLAKIAAKKRKVEHLKPSKKTNKRKYKTFAITE
ncbi:UTP20-like protein [Mya arenaria]|uniref:UTP20-like protein n=1 Tax=Mya arenaria TaxID=6604 RepID=A0ABY7EHF4_MYAAR|nr:UTP20-like protein [Mya arenaria]